jgi:transposase
MYLRTSRRKNKDGSVTEYYQLAHNERHPQTRKPVARIIHNFGRADQLNREELVRLCKSIARACDLQVIDPLRQGEDERPKEAGLEDFKLIGTVRLGTVVVIEALWERLGIGPILRERLQKKRRVLDYERALLAMTANRLCEPESKLGVWDRWLSKVYFPSCEGLLLRQMYEAMDFLYAEASEVEETVFFHIADLFNLDVDLVFYDTTTASFSIDEQDEQSEDLGSGLRQWGKPKEGGWAVQVVVALAVTREGLPVRCWVFPGNTTDVKTVEQIKADLRGWKLGRALFVADAGMNSQENRAELARACGKYLLATRMSSVAEIKQEVLSARGRFKVIHENLHAKEVVVGDGERRRRYIVCYNPKEAKRQQQHRAQLIQELEQELDRHPDKKATAQWAIELLASGRYKRYLRTTQKGQIRIDRGAIRQAQHYDGKWVLETNDDTITLEDAACGYKGLLVIERCFRSLKRTQIKMTPMFHWLPHRIEAHVRICVLALLIERVAELACSQSWFRIRGTLDALQATEFHTPRQVFFRMNEASQPVRQLFKSLAIPLPKRVLAITAHPKQPVGT